MKSLFTVLMIGGLVISACAAPTPEIIEEKVEKVVTQIVKETVIVEGTPQVVEKEAAKAIEKPTKIVSEREVVIDTTPPLPEPIPEKINTLRIAERTPTTITLAWHDSSDVEDGNILFRHTWREFFIRDAVEVRDLGPLNSPDGWEDCTDTGLSPDTRYCYRVVRYKGQSNSFSNIVCEPE